MLRVFEVNSVTGGVFALVDCRGEGSTRTIDLRTLATFADIGLVVRWTIASTDAHPNLDEMDRKWVSLSMAHVSELADGASCNAFEPDDAELIDGDVAMLEVSKDDHVIQKFAHKVVRRLVSARSFTNSPGSECVKLLKPPTGIALVVIDELVANDVVEVRKENDVWTLLLKPDHVEWRACRNVTGPAMFFHCFSSDILHSTSKLEAVLQLVQLGWLAIDTETQAFAPGGAKVFPKRMALRSGTGLKALLNAEDIFSRGAPCIDSNQCDGYYRCLHTLPDLAPFCARPDLAQLTNIQFMRLCKGLSVPTILFAIEDGGVDESVEDQVGGLLALEDGFVEEEVGGPLEGMMGMIAQSFGKPPIECDGMRVCFDGCSHHSGLQRLFIRCTEWDHGRCEKYLYLKDHPSANHAAAWLFAWQALGWMAPDHIEHYGFDPEDDHIAEYLGKLG